MTHPVTVITPSLPERAPMLAEAMASVADQYVHPVSHLVGVDHAGRGPAAVRQELIEAANTEWVAFLDDDDLLDPEHLDRLMFHALVDHLDVVIPHCRFDGPPLPDKYCNPTADEIDNLPRHGVFPITVVARRDAILRAGGFKSGDRYEDWSLWNRMRRRRATFGIVQTVTWTYRTSHPGRRTHAA